MSGGRADLVRPGELVVDPPTLHCVGFRWMVEGDANGNARCEVSYRKSGADEWKRALPLHRINREETDKAFKPYRAGNLLAGSILNLTPDTRYEVRLRLSDPDGGNEERLVSAKTRAVPPTPKGDRAVHIYPEGYRGPRETPNYTSVDLAGKDLQPGDCLLMHAGSYPNILLRGGGTAEKPIAIRAAGDGEVIVYGKGDTGNIIELQDSQYVQIEGLHILGGRNGIKANSAKGLVVRRCRIGNVESGIVSFTPDSEDWYIADNILSGRTRQWFPRKEGSGAGINAPGVGHVIVHNRTSFFWDGISIANYGDPKPEWAASAKPRMSAIDIYGNDITQSMDDGIECDYGLYNIRVWENRITNAQSGISAQPSLAGPLYLIRNTVYNTTGTPFKLHNHSTGMLVFHNTSVSASQAFTSYPPAWQNGRFRNNLFVGSRGWTLETGSPDRRTSLDYNGYARAAAEQLIKWSPDAGQSWGRYATVEEFARATGHETHGIVIDYKEFMGVSPPTAGDTYDPALPHYTLRPSSKAINAGESIPNVNEGFIGTAPDLGANENDQPRPHYGPRPLTQDEKL